jgi:hypothetical protein
MGQPSCRSNKVTNINQSITLPHQSDPAYYLNIEKQLRNITADFSKNHWTAQTTLAFQALPNTVGKASEARGGNAMGLKGTDQARFILEIAGVWNNKADDESMWSLARQLTNNLTTQLDQMKASGKAVGYNPLFMNDAGPDQDVFSTYKDVEKFAKLQREVDPKGFFAKRAGGYKFKQVV